MNCNLDETLTGPCWGELEFSNSKGGWEGIREAGSTLCDATETELPRRMRQDPKQSLSPSTCSPPQTTRMAADFFVQFFY